MSKKDLKCPYCGYEWDSYSFREHYNDEDEHDEFCPSREKDIVISMSVSITYDVYKKEAGEQNE